MTTYTVDGLMELVHTAMIARLTARRESEVDEAKAKVRAYATSLAQAKAAPVAGERDTHKQGCDALGGYGHGVGPCSCGAQPAQPDHSALLRQAVDALEDVTFVIDAMLGIAGDFPLRADGPAAKARDTIIALRAALKEKLE